MKIERGITKKNINVKQNDRNFIKTDFFFKLKMSQLFGQTHVYDNFLFKKRIFLVWSLLPFTNKSIGALIHWYSSSLKVNPSNEFAFPISSQLFFYFAILSSILLGWVLLNPNLFLDDRTTFHLNITMSVLCHYLTLIFKWKPTTL